MKGGAGDPNVLFGAVTQWPTQLGPHAKSKLSCRTQEWRDPQRSVAPSSQSTPAQVRLWEDVFHQRRNIPFWPPKTHVSLIIKKKISMSLRSTKFSIPSIAERFKSKIFSKIQGKLLAKIPYETQTKLNH